MLHVDMASQAHWPSFLVPRYCTARQADLHILYSYVCAVHNINIQWLNLSRVYRYITCSTTGPDQALAAQWQWLHYGSHTAYWCQKDHLHRWSAPPTKGTWAGWKLQGTLRQCVLRWDWLWSGHEIPQRCVFLIHWPSLLLYCQQKWFTCPSISSALSLYEGAGRVTFSSRVSFMTAMSYRFVQITETLTRRSITMYRYMYMAFLWWPLVTACGVVVVLM